MPDKDIFDSAWSIDDIDWFKANYINHLTSAIVSTSLARDMYARKHVEDFDIDWAMENFESTILILERMRDLERDCNG